jgi:hypothetical protein
MDAMCRDLALDGQGWVESCELSAAGTVLRIRLLETGAGRQWLPGERVQLNVRPEAGRTSPPATVLPFRRQA